MADLQLSKFVLQAINRLENFDKLCAVLLSQSLIFEMNENCSVKSVTLECDGVRALSVFGSADADFNKFLKLGTHESSRNESRLTVKLEKGNIVKFLQISFEKASEPFIAVNSVKFEV